MIDEKNIWIFILVLLVTCIFFLVLWLVWLAHRANQRLYKYRGPHFDKTACHKLFHYEDSHPRSPSGSRTHFIKGRREWIQAFIPFDEFSSQFGGWILWRAPQLQNQDIPAQAIGVWGHRNVSRLKRLMSERGANFETEKGTGPLQQIFSMGYGGKKQKGEHESVRRTTNA